MRLSSEQSIMELSADMTAFSRTDCVPSNLIGLVSYAANLTASYAYSHADDIRSFISADVIDHRGNNT